MIVKVEEVHLSRLRDVFHEHGHLIVLPSATDWKTKTDNDIWIRVVCQIVVAGNSAPAERLKEPSITEQLKWEIVSKMADQEARNRIWTVLRGIGTRFAGKSLARCKKTAALIHNLRVLKSFDGGPKGFISVLADIPTSKEKIAFLSRHFKYIKNKGARDFLISGFGLAHDCIALDVRVLGSLRQVGLTSLPLKTPVNTNVYDIIEKEIFDKICTPLNVMPAQLDQLLYQSYVLIKPSRTKGKSC